MLTRFLRIRNDFEIACRQAVSTIIVSVTSGILPKFQKYSSMIGEIEAITKVLQTAGRTVSYCREDISDFMKAVYDQNNTIGAPLYQSTLQFGRFEACNLFESRIC